MLKPFFDASTLFQVILLVFSLLTVIVLIAACVISFKHVYDIRKQIGGVSVLLLNSVLYILMQIDSRITNAEPNVHFPIPGIILFIIILLSFCFAVWSVGKQTKNRKTINSSSIKEAFDNLPTGACFFNEDGIPVLCNFAMHRFSFAVSGKDVQFIADLQDCLSDDFIPVEGTLKDGKIFTLADGKSYQLEKRTVLYDNNETYSQFTVLDVTDLQRNRVELIGENEQLRKAQEELIKLSANIVSITREEEILNTKMRVHDEMGKCLVEARKYLRDDTLVVPESVIHSWGKAVSMLKYNNDADDEDMLSQIRKTCESINLAYIQNGDLPKEESTAYILTCAVRECVTNAVRYAGAGELYAEFSESEDIATVVITNDGKQPDSEIVEGGGLSTLRRRIERFGGTMLIQSFPRFELTVTVPKDKDGLL